MIDELQKAIEQELDKTRYLNPWYLDAYMEIHRQIMIYGDMYDGDKITQMLKDKLLVLP